ncbi:MAG: VOC family protein [Thermomicrobiales bacterium]
MTHSVTEGFHHVTGVVSNAQRTIDFYRDVLGLSLVKKTVNFDVTDTYHLYFGSPDARPGTLLTFFEWPKASRGRFGVGGVHHVALSVRDEDTQLQWKRWLTEHGVRVSGPYDRGYFTSIYFTDPDGQVLEMATEGPGFAIDEPADALGQELKIPDSSRLPGGRDEATIAARTWPETVDAITSDMSIGGIHHVTGHTDDLGAAHDFYTEALGLSLVKMSLNQDDEKTRHYFWANYDGKTVKPSSDMTLFGWPAHASKAREGTGQMHHVAFRASDLDQMKQWREHLGALGLHVTDIKDRKYFQSIYFRTHDGLLIEIATDGPGFDVDEAPESLGQSLCLPEWLESQRDEIESGLEQLH